MFPTKQKIDIKICISVYSKHSIVCKSSESVSVSDFWRENSNGTVIHILLLKSYLGEIMFFCSDQFLDCTRDDQQVVPRKIKATLLS